MGDQGHLHITLGPPHLWGSHYLNLHLPTVWTLALVLVPIHREVVAVAPSYTVSR